MKRLWSSLESVQSLGAVEAEWRQYLGDLFPVLRAGMILEKVGQKASSVPCQQRPHCWHQVIPRGQGFVGKCKDDDGAFCDDVLLTDSDVEVWTLNVARLGRAIAGALKCEAKDVKLDVDRTRQIASLGSAPLPILLTLQGDSDGFTDIVANLVARWPKGFVLLAPTVRLCTASATVHLERVKAGFFPLEAIVELVEDGRFHAPKSGAELFAAYLPGREEALLESDSIRVWQLFSKLNELGAFRKAPPAHVFDLMVFKKLSKAQTATACGCAPSLITRRVASIEAHFQRRIEELRAFASDLKERQRTVKGDTRGTRKAGARSYQPPHPDVDDADGEYRDDHPQEEDSLDD